MIRGIHRRVSWSSLMLIAAAGTIITTRAIYAQVTQEVPPKENTYLPVLVEESFETIKKRDVGERDKFINRQQTLLNARYDLSDKPMDVKMSAGRKAVQAGVRVKLPDGVTWDSLANMTPQQIKTQDAFPMGFRPLPHVKHGAGGQVFPQDQIDEILRLEQRSLERFDVEFDLPVHFIPEFPAPIFLSSRPDLGDVSQGKLLSFKNYYEMFNGVLTPVQMEGLRLLLTPFPQQQFNQTEDRKVDEPSLGVSCLDCHANGHSNGAFHLNPDTRAQAMRFRIDTPSLRGMFNQQIHGSKRSLRSVEDFTEFEQRTAYFDGDHVIAMKKGVHLPNRTEQVSLMAQMQNMFDFPPAPKLDPFGRLMPDQATEQELRGEEIFFNKGLCAECHPAPFYLDDKIHDLGLERFYEPETISDQLNIEDGPIKTFTLRGIKDSPPYHHDGRLLTLADTIEFFNVVLGLKLNQQEKDDLVAFMLCL